MLKKKSRHRVTEKTADGGNTFLNKKPSKWKGGKWGAVCFGIMISGLLLTTWLVWDIPANVGIMSIAGWLISSLVYFGIWKCGFP